MILELMGHCNRYFYLKNAARAAIWTNMRQRRARIARNEDQRGHRPLNQEEKQRLTRGLFPEQTGQETPTDIVCRWERTAGSDRDLDLDHIVVDVGNDAFLIGGGFLERHQAYLGKQHQVLIHVLEVPPENLRQFVH